jgi:hypothetical protein
LKELKKAHKQAKRQAKKERRSAKRAAKRERRRVKKEVKRAMKDTKRGLKRGFGGAQPSGYAETAGPSRRSVQHDGLVTGVLSGPVPYTYVSPSGPPNTRTANIDDPVADSREAESLLTQAREMEHEALVKETVANGIRAAATSTDLPDKQRVKKLEEASVVYEEAEALRREVERLRNEAAHLGGDFDRDNVDYGKEQAHSVR